MTRASTWRWRSLEMFPLRAPRNHVQALDLAGWACPPRPPRLSPRGHSSCSTSAAQFLPLLLANAVRRLGGRSYVLLPRTRCPRGMRAGGVMMNGVTIKWPSTLVPTALSLPARGHGTGFLAALRR